MNENTLTSEKQSLTPEEREYRKNIDDCALEAIDRLIKNGSALHALYLMKKMFSLASESVFLYTGRLAQHADDGTDVYASEDLLSAAKKFLMLDSKPEPVLHIIVQKELDGGLEHPLVRMVQEMEKNGTLKGKLEIRQAPEGIEFNNHFMIMDDSAYRIEMDHDPCNALANFGDFKRAKRYAKFFSDTFFPSSKPIYPA